MQSTSGLGSPKGWRAMSRTTRLTTKTAPCGCRYTAPRWKERSCSVCDSTQNMLWLENPTKRGEIAQWCPLCGALCKREPLKAFETDKDTLEIAQWQHSPECNKC